MSNSTSTIYVLFALGRELAPFRRMFSGQRLLRGAPFRAFIAEGKSNRVLSAEMGVGPGRTRAALSWLGERSILGLPELIISAGFAGALADGLSVGDLVIPNEVVDVDGNFYGVPWPPQIDQTLGRFRCQRGRLLSTPALVGNPMEKQELARRHHALAVDMESATVAQFCRANNVAFGCVRCISDDARTPLSGSLIDLLVGGRVSKVRLASAIVREPKLARELFVLAASTARAGKNLAAALHSLLSENSPHVSPCPSAPERANLSRDWQ